MGLVFENQSKKDKKMKRLRNQNCRKIIKKIQGKYIGTKNDEMLLMLKYIWELSQFINEMIISILF